MSKTAVIRTGGKQYLVQENDVVLVEKIDVKEEANHVFDDVLLVATDKTVKIGTPTVSGAKVTGKVVQQGRHPKIFGVKMKAKKRNKKYFGHKQPYTKVEITKISTSTRSK